MKIKNFDSILNGIFSPTQDFIVDIYENDSHYLLNTYLPGIKKEAINVMYEDDILSIYLNLESFEKYRDYRKIRQESSDYCKMRSFYIPNIILQASTASYKDGVLVLNLPKSQLIKNNYIINVE